MVERDKEVAVVSVKCHGQGTVLDEGQGGKELFAKSRRMLPCHLLPMMGFVAWLS